MLALVLILSCGGGVPPMAVPLATGQAAYYAAGVMQQVAEYRGLPLREYVGGVAVISADPRWLGQEVFLRYGEGDVEGPFLVIDVAAAADLPDLYRKGEVIEIDYHTATRWGVAGGGLFGPVTVYRRGDSEDSTDLAEKYVLDRPDGLPSVGPVVCPCGSGGGWTLN